MKKDRIIVFLFFQLLLLLIMKQATCQNNTCETAKPFCTGTMYEFPAGVNAGVGQSGPCYNCLFAIPNPAWYYLKIGTSGNIIMDIQSEPARDIDFCCWGPFLSSNSCSQLTCNKVVSCSYSADSNKTCTIPNGLTGQYYILVATNYSNLPCNIIFTQTGGTGSTDCSILPPPCSNNTPVCVSQPIQLFAATVLGGTYHWTGPNGYTNNEQNPVIPNAQLSNSGDYYLHVMVNGQPYGDSTKTTVLVYQIIANAGNDTTIQNGVSTVLHGSASQGSGAYHYHWEPATLLANPNVQSPTTVNLYSTTIFTLTATDDSASCQGQDLVTVNIAGGALAVNGIAIPSTICAGTTTQLQAIGSGGSGNYSYEWSGPNGFSSTMQNPTVQPMVTSTFMIKVHDGYNTATNSVTVIVHPLPVANAGENKSIPYGTYTFLNGTVTNGSGNYFYSWTPEEKLINSHLPQPQTVNLIFTTVYSLVVTDLASNCLSDNQTNVTIEVTGGPLNAVPVATPDSICLGDTTQLHACAGGGNVGFYEYSWSSNPPGFTSTLPEPFVSPDRNTTYSVTVYDGFNTVIGNIDVNLYPKPQIHLGPADTTICIYDTLKLDAGNPGSIYLWSNGATSQVIWVGTAGIGFDIQTYTVKVTNRQGCIDTSTIQITYSFTSCVGIRNNDPQNLVKIYPNPSSGVFTIENNGYPEDLTLTLLNIHASIIETITLKMNKSGKTTKKIDLIGYPPGIYLLRFESDSQLWTEKLVIR